jgi:polyferredoxin
VSNQNSSCRAESKLTPPFHPHSHVSILAAVQNGCSRFSRCCHLIDDVSFCHGVRFAHIVVKMESASQRRGTQVVRERSAKPSFVGSIPARASK